MKKTNKSHMIDLKTQQYLLKGGKARIQIKFTSAEVWEEVLQRKLEQCFSATLHTNITQGTYKHVVFWPDTMPCTPESV